jgi:hypothetical protein
MEMSGSVVIILIAWKMVSVIYSFMQHGSFFPHLAIISHSAKMEMGGVISTHLLEKGNFFSILRWIPIYFLAPVQEPEVSRPRATWEEGTSI